jgi:hypothetical protein
MPETLGVLLEDIKDRMREVRTAVDIAVDEVDFYESTFGFEIRSPALPGQELPTKPVSFNAGERSALRTQFRGTIQTAIDELEVIKELIP